MTGVRDQLLDFHAAYTYEELRTNSAYQALLAAHEGTEPFETLRARIVKVNAGFEGGLRNADGAPGQVIAALTTALQYIRRREWREMCRDLAHRRWDQAWSPAQLAYFDAALEKLGDSDDVFLSYTNYNPSAPDGMNAVNIRYQELITTGGGLLVERPHGVHRNLVAKMLKNKLSEGHLQVFYWEQDQDPSAVVEARLRTKVDGALVFLQLIQSQLFERDPAQTPNYCLLEYEAASADPTRVIVLLIEPFAQLIQPEDIEFAAFDAWYAGVMAITLDELAQAGTFAEARAEIDRVVAKLTRQRNEARERVIASVPSA
jgi:hypothetical protein